MIDRPLVLLGAPGSGKGTLTRILTGIWPVPVIATGDLLRKEAAADGPLAASLRAKMESGELISEELVNEIAGKRIAEPDCSDGFILDGYPRTRSQAGFLDKLVKQLHMPMPTVIDLVVSPAVARDRMLARVQCPLCGTIYNLRERPPAHPDLCDHDGMRLFRRSDDNQAAIENRIRIYQQTISPLVEFCQSRWDYHRIDADQTPANLVAAVQDIFMRWGASTYASKMAEPMLRA